MINFLIQLSNEYTYVFSKEKVVFYVRKRIFDKDIQTESTLYYLPRVIIPSINSVPALTTHLKESKNGYLLVFYTVSCYYKSRGLRSEKYSKIGRALREKTSEMQAPVLRYAVLVSTFVSIK